MNINQNPPKWQSWVKTILIIVSIVFIIVFIKYFDMTQVKAVIQKNPQLSVIISLVIYFFSSFTFIPSSPLTLFMSVLSGPTLAIAVAAIGNTLSALVQYYIGTTLTSVKNFDELRNKMPSFLRTLPINSPLFLLAGRVIPGGMRGLSVICGFYHVPFSTYVWTTVTMYLVSSIVIVFGGTELVELL